MIQLKIITSKKTGKLGTLRIENYKLQIPNLMTGTEPDICQTWGEMFTVKHIFCHC